MLKVLHILQFCLVDLGKEKWGGEGRDCSWAERDQQHVTTNMGQALTKAPQSEANTTHWNRVLGPVTLVSPQDSDEEQTFGNPTINNSTSQKTQTKPRSHRGFFISQRDLPAGNIFLKTRQGFPHFSPISAPVLILALLLTGHLKLPFLWQSPAFLVVPKHFSGWQFPISFAT